MSSYFLRFPYFYGELEKFFSRKIKHKKVGHIILEFFHVMCPIFFIKIQINVLDKFYGKKRIATHVAGIIAAENNKEGGIGVAYNCKVMVLKAGNSSGYFNNSDIAEAIQ